MTKALPFTEHALKRAIAAARKSGLRITGIRPDGTLTVEDGADPCLAPAAPLPQSASALAEEDVWGNPKA